MKLNKHQREAVIWALDCMWQYWDRDSGEGYEAVMDEGPQWPEPTDWHLPAVRSDRTLILSNWHEVNDDLAYRIGTQLVDMIQDGAEHQHSRHVRRRMTQACVELHTYIRARMTAPQNLAPRV